MARDSAIEWTTHTFYAWWGCTKVSPACRGCYAEGIGKWLWPDPLWGPGADRRMLGDANWKQPLAWDRKAGQAGTRARVFCSSMSDVFEDRRDLDPARERLWALIAATPNLDWLLLTKRPEAVARLVPWNRHWPANVWIGITAENQRYLDERMAELARIPAVVRFISAEPLLGPLDLRRWSDKLDWVITGGETGGKARASSPAWFRSLLIQCVQSEIEFHFKQWGEWRPALDTDRPGFAMHEADDGTMMARVGKKHAGRMLEEAEWDGVPTPRQPDQTVARWMLEAGH